MIAFMNGITVALCGVAAIFFLKFWRASKDRLFLMFSIAFWILAIERVVLTVRPLLNTPTTERDSAIYLLRLLAFVFLLIAIVDKNRRSVRSR